MNGFSKKEKEIRSVNGIHHRGKYIVSLQVKALKEKKKEEQNFTSQSREMMLRNHEYIHVTLNKH